MKKRFIVLMLLFFSTLFMGCSPAAVLETEPSAEEVLVMYENYIKGDTVALKEYLGEIPENLSKIQNPGTYEEFIAEAPDLADVVTPETVALMAEIQKDTYEEAVYTNELVKETDTTASFKVTTIGRDFTPAISETFLTITSQGLNETDMMNILYQNMKTLYQPSEPQIIDINLIKNVDGKWEISESNVEKLATSALVLDFESVSLPQ